eukprot:997136-Rhodomonas_salina.4
MTCLQQNRLLLLTDSCRSSGLHGWEFAGRDTLTDAGVQQAVRLLGSRYGILATEIKWGCAFLGLITAPPQVTPASYILSWCLLPARIIATCRRRGACCQHASSPRADEET